MPPNSDLPPAGPASAGADAGTGKSTGAGLGASSQLAEAILRARWALGWERTWPHLARLMMVAGLFLAVSWLGLWIVLPLAGRIAGLAVFGLLIIAALLPLRHWRWPSQADALRRLDRGSGLRHRPVTALNDHLATQDPVAQALWRAQLERTASAIGKIKAGLPSPRLAWHDPRALRALVAVLLVATFVAAGAEREDRIAAAFDWDGVLSGTSVRLDAWVTPPGYTGRPPVILSGPNNPAAPTDTAEASPLQVPAGSILLVRASSGKVDVAITGGLTEIESTEKAPIGTDEKRFLIGGDGTARVRAPSGHPLWRFTAAADRAPSISLAKDPERQARGSLLLSYKLEDDYGVTEAHAAFTLRAPAADAKTAEAQVPPGTILSEQSKELLRQQAAARKPRPLYDPPSFALILPNARTRSGIGQTVKDLSEHPYAGADVTLTLSAKDEAGNEGHSEPFDMRLPERLFSKPLARALIEQRRILALDANKRGLVSTALDALLIAPEMFTPEAGIYLSLSSLSQQLARATNDDKLRETVDSMWALATLIEDGNSSDAQKALRAAQDALRQALERGATDEEIKALMDQLRAALDNYMRQLAEQMQKNPQLLARPLDPNTRILRQQDLSNMLNRMERLSRNGDKDAARALLDQMQEMLDNLQMAQPGQGGDSDMEQALNELGDMIRKQQQLRDRTFKQGQDSRRGQNGDPNALSGLQQDQRALRDRLNKLQKDLAQRGLGKQPGEGMEQGGSGDSDNLDPGFGDADSAMNDADSQLGDGNPDSAVDAQGRALEALRKGAQKLAEAMQQQMGEGDDGDGQPGGPGNRRGRQQNSAQSTDPLGRPLRGHEFGDDLSVQVPGEIDVQRVRRILEELRRRLGEANRPQIELDYLERLLKDY